MYLIAITKWKKKLVYLISLLIISTLLISLIPKILGQDTVKTDGSVKEEDILSQPIKVQSQPNMEKK
ncbi:MAG: hypothetical protein PWQ67_2539 [Clostridia bacterium]|jgi:competence protein ComGC|nr:hypothetical protein [Clostridia bacterium]MDN5324085.1 hypothetical protein [Clostridia bacterium]